MSLLKKLSQIVDGYENWIFEDEETKQLSGERLNICLSCPHRSDIDKSPNKITLLSFCTQCGCNLKAKTHCKTCECPLKYWNNESRIEGVNGSNK